MYHNKNNIFKKYNAKCTKCRLIQEHYNKLEKQCIICNKLEYNLINEYFYKLYNINITDDNKKFITLKKNKSTSNLCNYI